MSARDPDQPADIPPLVELKILIPEDLYRAFQRSLWVRIHETRQTQLQLMEEVIRDFLIKHGC